MLGPLVEVVNDITEADAFNVHEYAFCDGLTSTKFNFHVSFEARSPGPAQLPTWDSAWTEEPCLMELGNSGRPREVAAHWTFCSHTVLYKPIGDAEHPILLARFDFYLEYIHTVYNQFFSETHYRHRFYCKHVLKLKGEGRLLGQPLASLSPVLAREFVAMRPLDRAKELYDRHVAARIPQPQQENDGVAVESAQTRQSIRCQRMEYIITMAN